ncbi:hypothetical protein [Gluconobacter sp. P5E10]|uniref:hypothetical protein n=1 Tax=Gluconobacter sp. P5E10 TaxID=2762613 RepID=UPI001C05B7A6|nr:hypothetical protein [Gluconobacter sp. P5E10]
MRLCPLPGNAKRASHVVEVGDRRLSAPVLLNRQAGQGGKPNVGYQFIVVRYRTFTMRD